MTKLTPRQIEILTEVFDGVEVDWRNLTPAQRNGRRRVLDDMRGWHQHSLMEPKGETITLAGLKALEPHYRDKGKIATAMKARGTLERERVEAREREKREREEATRLHIERRNAALVEGYRRILADHHFDLNGKTDDLILSVGRAIYDFEGTV